jgi:hypothetical protein|tara:strand:- start:1661 stop:2071 length:411 start_codon:yes stop_codon:yes gene_type:complete
MEVLYMSSGELNSKTFLLYTMNNYNNPKCSSMEDFYEDLNRIKYIKRLLGRYHQKNILKERLILNHIIILGNLFGTIPTTRILFFKLNENLHPYLKTFLDFLDYLPEIQEEVPEVVLEKIPVDLKIVKTLRGLGNE